MKIEWLVVNTVGSVNEADVDVDVDVRCPVLVPLLLCPPKGSLWGAVKA